MELQRNMIVREIKRLEFQVARLASGTRSEGGSHLAT